MRRPHPFRPATWHTMWSTTARLFPRGRRCYSSTGRPIATSYISPTLTGSISTAKAAISASDTVSTSASVQRWPGYRPGSHSRRYSHVGRTGKWTTRGPQRHTRQAYGVGRPYRLGYSMANSIEHESNTPIAGTVAEEPTGTLPRSRFAWGIFGIAYAMFAVATIATMQIGLHGDPRTTNPNPGPAPYPPFLGFDNWPLVIAFTSIPLAIGLVGSLLCLSRRQGGVHWAAIIAFAGLVTGAMDPLANWATFAVFDPRMLHFPLSWPYVSISPNLEPALSFLGGYAAYYLLTGIGLLQAHDRFIDPFIRRDSWLSRHRLTAVFAGAFVVAIPLNTVVQFLWLKFGIFVYTEAVGPVLRIGHIYLPVIMVIYDCFIFAMVAVLCVRDDDGGLVLVTSLARRLPSRPGRPTVPVNRQILVALVGGVVAFALPLAVLARGRSARGSQPAYDKFPYPTVKVYDPYGHLEEAGKPGPVYK